MDAFHQLVAVGEVTAGTRSAHCAPPICGGGVHRDLAEEAFGLGIWARGQRPEPVPEVVQRIDVFLGVLPRAW